MTQMVRVPGFFDAPALRLRRLIPALSLVLVMGRLALSLAAEVPSPPTTAGQGKTQQEQLILREFWQSLGQGLKVFQALTADLTGEGRPFIILVTQTRNDRYPKLRIFQKWGEAYKAVY